MRLPAFRFGYHQVCFPIWNEGRAQASAGFGSVVAWSAVRGDRGLARPGVRSPTTTTLVFGSPRALTNSKSLAALPGAKRTQPWEAGDPRRRLGRRFRRRCSPASMRRSNEARTQYRFRDLSEFIGRRLGPPVIGARVRAFPFSGCLASHHPQFRMRKHCILIWPNQLATPLRLPARQK